MTIGSKREFVTTWFEQVWNIGDISAVDRLMSPTARFHGLVEPGETPAIGPATFKPFVQSLRGALPDIRIEVLRTVCEGDTVASYCKVTGTHTGPGLGAAPPSGKSIEVYGLGMAVIRDGQIQESWNCFDFLSLYQQLGLLPPLATAQ